MAEFRVVIDGELHPKQVHAIERAIQQAVLPHLVAAWDDGDPLEPLVFVPHRPIPPREWRGFVAARVPEQLQRHVAELSG